MRKKTAVMEDRESATSLPRTGDAPLMKPFEKKKARVEVNKAYKMYVGGAFVRSESGRYFQVESQPDHHDPDPDVVNVPRGSRFVVELPVRYA